MTTAGVDLDIEPLLRLRTLAAAMRDGQRPPRSALPGAALHRRRGRGLELYDIRAWSDGDDMRHLDRNVTARTGTPHVRGFRDERERSVLFVVDFRPSTLFGTRRAFRSVVAAEAAALLAWRVIDDGGSIRLLIATADGARQIGRARGARAMITGIGELAAAHREALASDSADDPPLADLLEEAAAFSRDSSIVVATALDAPGERFDIVAERLACKRDLSIALVCDRFDIDPPPGAYPFRTAMGEAGLLRVEKRTPPDARLARLRRLGVNFMPIDAGHSAETMASALERLDG